MDTFPTEKNRATRKLESQSQTSSPSPDTKPAWAQWGESERELSFFFVVVVFHFMFSNSDRGELTAVNAFRWKPEDSPIPFLSLPAVWRFHPATIWPSFPLTFRRGASQCQRNPPGAEKGPKANVILLNAYVYKCIYIYINIYVYKYIYIFIYVFIYFIILQHSLVLRYSYHIFKYIKDIIIQLSIYLHIYKYIYIYKNIFLDNIPAKSN